MVKNGKWTTPGYGEKVRLNPTFVDNGYDSGGRLRKDTSTDFRCFSNLQFGNLQAL